MVRFVRVADTERTMNVFRTLLLAIIVLVFASCADNDEQLRGTAWSISSFESDPRPHAQFLLKDASRLERFHSFIYFGATENPEIPSTVVGRLAEIYCIWGDWESAIRFSRLALNDRRDPRAVSALLRATVESGQSIHEEFVLDELRASNPPAAVDFVRLRSGAKAAMGEGQTLLLKTSSPLIRSAICLRLASANRTTPEANRIYDQLWLEYFPSADSEETWFSALRKGGADVSKINSATCDIAWICLYALESDAVKSEPDQIAIWRNRYKKLLESLLQSDHPNAFATIFLRSQSEKWK